MQGLIGSSGFVGGALQRQRSFDGAYNSKTIGQIAGRRFERVVCAGAPATMWAANNQPEADAANLASLLASLRSASIGKLVLISTVAVFDDVSAGYTESHARYEQAKAYGRNRRRLEEDAAEAFDCHILRLPALFGKGLKKNFIFDLMNPIPSFLTQAKHDELSAAFAAADRALLADAFAFDPGLNMWAFDRDRFGGDPRGGLLEAAFRRAGFISRNFTNSDSAYQYYNIERLADDIDLCVEHGVRVLNVCSAPLRAGEIHEALFGEPFQNAGPAKVSEDVRSEHGALFGASGPYLIEREAVLADLQAYVRSGEGA